MKYLKTSLQVAATGRSFSSAIRRTHRMVDTLKLDAMLKNVDVVFECDKHQDGYRYGAGDALRFVRPKTTQQVSEILKYCNEAGVEVVPQGGNTGLVGASTADKSGKQIVLSTELLNKDLVQENGNSVRVGAGVVLDALNEKLASDGMFLPIDIGSSGSCNIGGLIATNAAGTRAGRYGNTKSRTLETKVVLASGEIRDVVTDMGAINKDLPQDNSHIDLQNPFIGSQGWLGVVTEAVMRLEERPKRYDTVVLVPRDVKAVRDIRKSFEKAFGDGLTAFEGMAGDALRLVAKNIPNTRYLFEGEDEVVDYALFVEVASKDESQDLEAILMRTLARLMEDGDVVTGLQGKPDIYWHNRHHISEAVAKEGKVIATDIAVSGAGNLGAFREEMTVELLAKHPDLKIVPFGHEMLGAVHFNVVWPKGKELSAAVKRDIQEAIYDKAVNAYGGTFSAEHGVGPHNQWAYDKFTSEGFKASASKLKQELDPNGILNPNVGYGVSKVRGLN